MRSMIAIALIGLAIGAGSVYADTSATPEARTYIERYGIGFPFDHEQEIIALYTRVLAGTQHDTRGVEIVRGLRYGDDERNRLDVHYVRSAKHETRPVVIFFHGGGFFSGDTCMSAEIYDNVGNYFARNGLIGVNATYRLTPQAHWPSGVDDVATALTWAREYVGEYGGDPGRIFLMGHSAGAAHVAGYAFSDRIAAGPPVAGVILFSGRYTVTDKTPYEAYYGTDVSQRFKQSPLNFVDSAPRTPVMIMFGQYDPPPMQYSAIELIQKLCERDQKCPVIEQVMGHNHMSEIFHFDTADDSGARAVLEFVRAASRTP